MLVLGIDGCRGGWVSFIEDAAFILERIDARWPTIVNSFSAKTN
jgi:hypothetical protein